MKNIMEKPISLNFIVTEQYGENFELKLKKWVAKQLRPKQNIKKEIIDNFDKFIMKNYGNRRISGQMNLKQPAKCDNLMKIRNQIGKKILLIDLELYLKASLAK